MVAKVLSKIGASVKAWAIMHKAVVQGVLLYGRKIWVVTDVTITALKGFHYRTKGRIAGATLKKVDIGELERASMDDDL